MEVLDFACIYLDHLSCIFKARFNEHLEYIKQVLVRLQKANIKVKASKSSFGNTEIKFLEYVVIHEEMKLHPKTIEAIQKIARPTVTEVHSFLGMVQYYRDVWQKRIRILTPLTELTCGK